MQWYSNDTVMVQSAYNDYNTPCNGQVHTFTYGDSWWNIQVKGYSSRDVIGALVQNLTPKQIPRIIVDDCQGLSCRHGTSTAPARHHHHTATVPPSPHHHCTITAPPSSHHHHCIPPPLQHRLPSCGCPTTLTSKCAHWKIQGHALNSTTRGT